MFQGRNASKQYSEAFELQEAAELSVPNVKDKRSSLKLGAKAEGLQRNWNGQLEAAAAAGAADLGEGPRE